MRAKDISSSGFKAALFEEDSLSDGHTVETVSYLAITPKQGQVGGSFTYNISLSFPFSFYTLQVNEYSIESVDITDDGVTAGGYTFYNQEEESADPETSHTTETIHVLEINGMTFAQQVTSNGRDTTSLRRE